MQAHIPRPRRDSDPIFDRSPLVAFHVIIQYDFHLTANISYAMVAVNMQSPQESIETYLRAKDENRPHLMKRAFAETATLEMVVKTASIAFPPISQGLQSISDVLVRRFAQNYENVHTFCLAAPPRIDEVSFSCDWLVGMSEKGSRIVRVGCGRYDWRFRSHGPRLVDQLTITVELMQSLSPSSLSSVMEWLSPLPYPWCSAQMALMSAPILDELEPIRHYVARASA